MPVRDKTPGRARAAARAATTVAKARIPARARAAARPTVPRWISKGDEGSRAKQGLAPRISGNERLNHHARKSIQRLHGLRYRHRAPDSALRPHPEQKTGCGLV